MRLAAVRQPRVCVGGGGGYNQINQITFSIAGSGFRIRIQTGDLNMDPHGSGFGSETLLDTYRPGTYIPTIRSYYMVP